METKTVAIDKETHQTVLDYCKEKGKKLSFFVTEAIKEKLAKETQNDNL